MKVMDYIKRIFGAISTLVKSLSFSAFKEIPPIHESSLYNSFNVSLHKRLPSS